METHYRCSFLHFAAVCLCAAAVGLWSLRAGAAEADIFERPDPWGQVMYLGTYHMANPGLDEFNLNADDVRTEKRQKEIKATVRALARFKPTKIAVEARPELFDDLKAAYQAYVKGEKELARNETQQIGFRLAKRMGHEAVHPIDVRYTFMSEQHKALEEELESAPRLQELLAGIEAYGVASIRQMGEKLSTMAIGPFLSWLNAPAQITANHDYYARFLMLGWHEDNQGGAHTVANWYARNILIFQNILRLMEGGKGERVLVIFGQGHVKIFQDLTKDSPYTELVDVRRYLPRR